MGSLRFWYGQFLDIQENYKILSLNEKLIVFEVNVEVFLSQTNFLSSISKYLGHPGTSSDQSSGRGRQRVRVEDERVKVTTLREKQDPVE